MSKWCITSYSERSAGASALAQALGLRLINRDVVYGMTPSAISEMCLINWGAGNSDLFRSLGKENKVINHPKSIAFGGGSQLKKLTLLEKAGVSIPTWTKEFTTALGWLRDGLEVFTKDNVKSPATSFVFFEDDPGAFSRGTIWYQYKKRSVDFRVHVVGGHIVYVEERVPLAKHPETGLDIDPSMLDRRFKVFENCYVFEPTTRDLPGRVAENALKTIAAYDLDFGCVDVLWNAVTKKAYVTDVETCPLMTPELVKAYTEKLKPMLD